MPCYCETDWRPIEARSAEHVHPADPGRRLKAEVTAKVRMFLVY